MKEFVFITVLGLCVFALFDAKCSEMQTRHYLSIP